MTETTEYAAVPELDGQVMLTDTGFETDAIFHAGYDLPLFAAFVLADTPDGREHIRRWHRDHARLAIEHGLGVSLDAVAWRASSDWGDQLGYDAKALDRVNRELVGLLQELRAELDAGDLPVRVGAQVGPRSDGYAPTLVMSAAEAQSYHAPQVRSLAAAGADRLCALTLGYAAEGVGIASAARLSGLPALIGFTVETDGRLPDGSTLEAAVTAVDAETDAAPAGYLVNCAHPDHLARALGAPEAPWMRRLIGIRPNSSRRSHAELDEAEDLDAGDAVELATQVAGIRAAYPWIALVGGCCGTDLTHARAIAAAVSR